MPVLALLISGGHTELVLMRDWLAYELVGATRDDAVGEAFDKVARLLDLPYPGGPQNSDLAERARMMDLRNPSSNDGFRKSIILPRPMMHEANCDFSFAGLKTAVRYLVRDLPECGEGEQKQIAREFEDAVADVLWKKTARALEATGARTLAIGGGVSANRHIRRVFETEIAHYPDISLRIPQAILTTDNALMIAMAGYYRALRRDFANVEALRANGNLRLAAYPKDAPGGPGAL
jgi:N6-L-threonylcarbamoyladenine synthase